jgi:hypothetical protein
MLPASGWFDSSSSPAFIARCEMTERDIGHGGQEEQVDLVDDDDDDDEPFDDGVGESGRDMSRSQVSKSLQREE